MSAAPTKSKSLKRLAYLIVFGALLIGLCLWWGSRVSPQPVIAAPTPRIFFRREIEIGRIANAEITKREGWSGKVRLLIRSDEAPLAWVVWVEGKDGSQRRIRFLRIDEKTDKILDYQSAQALPDSAWDESVLLH